jgi:hypothetical protein
VKINAKKEEAGVISALSASSMARGGEMKRNVASVKASASQ